jgi:SAM-dependent methyltransferase
VATKIASPPDPELIEPLLLSQYTECGAELTLLGRCGRHLADVLSGRLDPVELLFPGGSSQMVERLYQDSPFARTLNTLVEETILQAFDGLSENQPLKILEIGGGTGGTSAQLIPRLSAARTEYLFTDVSELFTRSAQQKFRRFPFVRFGLLDIERDPIEQGFAAGQFDLILAANVVHATRDLTETMTHVRRLLAPGGMLVLLEGRRPERWLDLTFVLTTGWWRFHDTWLRPDYPLLDAGKWLELLARCGFEQTAALPEAEAAGNRELLPQAFF